MTLDVSRRTALALGLGAAALPLVSNPLAAAALSYAMSPKKISDGVWLIEGANKFINERNGGAIANITILDTGTAR